MLFLLEIYCIAINNLSEGQAWILLMRIAIYPTKQEQTYKLLTQQGLKTSDMSRDNLEKTASLIQGYNINFCIAEIT